jgi:hypothetical protein
VVIFLSIFFPISVRQKHRLLRSVAMGAEKLANVFFEWSGKGLMFFVLNSRVGRVRSVSDKDALLSVV